MAILNNPETKKETQFLPRKKEERAKGLWSDEKIRVSMTIWMSLGWVGKVWMSLKNQEHVQMNFERQENLSDETDQVQIESSHFLHLSMVLCV